ncbi:hypothetical protein, partial [Klebsiella michiganensis]|uniref:hypothetical protein n=1 Tax=Klebsiella michiganensis TaxID=1134687 RepID=UPI001953B2BA
VVTLAPEAHHRALDLTRTNDMDVEYWPTPDPTLAQGSREQRLDAYRQVRDMLLTRIRQRFSRRDLMRGSLAAALAAGLPDASLAESATP